MKSVLGFSLARPVAVVLVCAAPLPVVAPEITMRINHTMGVDSFPDRALARFAEAMEERTEGRVSVRIYSSGELGQELEQYDLMQVGAIEAALLGGQILSAVAPEYAAFEMPYLWRDQNHLRSVWAGEIGQEIAAAILERKGIRIVGVYDRGARHLTANVPVLTPGDLAGLRIRTTQNPVHVAAWEALGALPTPMPFGEVFMGLRQGVIDGQENPLDLIASSSLDEVQSHLHLTEHVRSVGWFGVSEMWFAGLPEDIQTAILEESEIAMASNDAALAEEEDAILRELEARMTVIPGSEMDLEAFREAVSGLPAEFSSSWKEGFVEAIIASE